MKFKQSTLIPATQVKKPEAKKPLPNRQIPIEKGKCQKCGASIAPQYKYCIFCWRKFMDKGFINSPNKKLSRCKVCGAEVEARYDFCYECVKQHPELRDESK